MLIYEKVAETLPVILTNGKERTATLAEIDSFFSAVPIVLTPSGETDAEVESFEGGLDLPFKTCFFEYFSGAISRIKEGGGDYLNIVGILIEETAPRQYILRYALRDFNSKKNSKYVLLHELIYPNEESRADVENHCLGMVKDMLKRFYTEKIGHSSPRTPIKIKAHGQKMRSRINKVIYVTDRPESLSSSASLPKEINWSHRWLVRGHWRKNEGKIGKDRDGNYVVKGFTWVTDHEKGPENSPLIKKTYLVN